MAFDTLAYAQRLKAAGVDEEQAEAHAQAVRDAVTETTASKADLESGFARLGGRMDLLETRLDDRIQASEARMDLLETRLEERIQTSEARMDAMKASLEERIQASEARQEASNARRDTRMMAFIVAVAALAVAAAELIP